MHTGKVLVAAMIRMTSANSECAIDLLGCYNRSELVGERNPTKGYRAGCDSESLGGPAVGGANGENEMLNSGVLSGAEDGGKVLGSELLASAVGEKKCGTSAVGGAGQKLDESVLGGEDLERTWGVAGGARNVELEEHRRGASGAGATRRNHCKKNVHRGGELGSKLFHYSYYCPANTPDAALRPLASSAM